MSARKSDAITQALKQKGLRITPQRYAIYANLLARSDHPTVEQLMSQLNQDLPISSQATVYNSLQTLCEVGLVREVLLEHGVARYDAKVDAHHHFVCDQCGAIKDIDWDVFQGLDLSRVKGHVQAIAYEVTVRGLCEDCQ
jgi:Fur family peroxide stress response transcriptional regulator